MDCPLRCVESLELASGCGERVTRIEKYLGALMSDDVDMDALTDTIGGKIKDVDCEMSIVKLVVSSKEAGHDGSSETDQSA
ncbi:hypothetical protein Pyn_31107 [Prunus yedoensis var. nudiflora]|uniref:Uncharacterized protein n=1 Tax=Prunus yedoensis var. nudiflora TaxID=2094558 RepID=A0A314ZJL1_PRUYE|nr:hypothetical protein Pyn_31107 [Prunus yedoensis var. nudiflora]